MHGRGRQDRLLRALGQETDLPDVSRGRIVLLYGSRPEAIKMGPVAAELRALRVQPTIVSTGQHTDLLVGTPAFTDLAGSCSLGLESNGHVQHWVAKAVPEIMDALETMRPISALVVQGDTMSAYAGALAAERMHVPLAHVEAGLRSHSDLEPWPEEVIRKAISEKAFWHYAPTETAKANLLNEHIPEFAVRVTGNTVVSAMHRYADPRPWPIPDQQVMVTMHRREFLDHGADWVHLTIDAFLSTADEYPNVRFLWPMHPNIQKTVNIQRLLPPNNVTIVGPLTYQGTIMELGRSTGICTDSGGLQEESCTMGIPCAVLRNVSDRPESIANGMARLFPPSAVGMVDGIRWILEEEHDRTPQHTFGDAHAARKIAEHLATLV